jgi:O-antigen/teichoic acid export membrane protein
VTIVSLMIILAPVEALDGILTDMFAVFRSARAIFVRRYILAPALRLLVVTVLVLTSAGVEFLAIGYVLTGLLGVFLYVTMLPGLFRRAGVIGGPGPSHGSRRVSIPFREVAAYTIPLLTIDLVLLSMSSLDAIIVGNIHGTEEVARLRVVESTARLNAIVFTTFAILFTPAAARLFARGDRTTMRDLYWRSAAWIAVLSFPIFVLTFSLATPVTVFLFDERYRSSGIILATLALARYIDAAFGPNGQTIRMFGGVKEIVVVNLVTAAVHLGLAIVLIPPLAAEGAALAILLSFILYNVLKQIALRRVTGVPMFEMAYLPIYATIALAALIIAGLEVSVDPPLPVALLLAALASVLVIALGRRSLRIAETFPELLRFPGGRFLR